jgi:hypothetical protein
MQGIVKRRLRRCVAELSAENCAQRLHVLGIFQTFGVRDLDLEHRDETFYRIAVPDS